MPLVSIEEAVEPLVDLVPSVQKNVYVAKRNCENPTDGLTVDQSASIMLYTMEQPHREESLYCILNVTLRFQDQNKLKPWLLYLRLMLTGLRKLPPFRGTVYRGVPCDLRTQYPTGSTHTWPAFSGATTSVEFLESDSCLGKEGSRSLIQIECTSGRSIREHSCFQEENEVLLLPDFRFVVKSVLDVGNGLQIVNLKEIEPS